MMPSWSGWKPTGTPKVGKLPLERTRAYQLDLEDPDHDRFDSAFSNGSGNTPRI